MNPWARFVQNSGGQDLPRPSWGRPKRTVMGPSEALVRVAAH